MMRNVGAVAIVVLGKDDPDVVAVTLNEAWTCATPRRIRYKRIDYAFAKTLTPLSMTRFNRTGEPGVTKQADHAGLKIEYAY